MQVFISYAREDSDTAYRLYESLRAYPDLSSWLDKKNLLAGTSWENSIREAISSSDIVILLISETSISKTTFIRREIEIIIDRLSEGDSEVLLLPVRLDDSIAPWPEISRLEMIDLYASWTEGMHRLMAAIRARTGELEARLQDAYPDRSGEERYRRALMFLLSEDELEHWSSAFEDVISSLPPAVVFHHLDAIHPIYMDEMMDLMLAMNLVRHRHPEAIPSYAFRLHEVAKSVTAPHEFPEAYGVVLSASRLLEAPIRTMFIRDMYTSFLGVAHHSLSGLATWPQEWTLCELSKHLMTQTKARYESNQEIVYDVLECARVDVPAMDLFVFAGRLSGDYRFLLTVYELLRRLVRIDLPSVPSDARHAGDITRLNIMDLSRFDRLKRADADLAERCRLGALARIGEYLTRNEHNGIAAFGAEVMGVALDAMDDDQSSVAEDVLALTAQQRADLFDALETYQDHVPATLAGEATAARLKRYWTDYFYTYHYEDGWELARLELDVSPTADETETP